VSEELVHFEIPAREIDRELKDRVMALWRASFPEIQGTPKGSEAFWDWKFKGREASLWATKSSGANDLLAFYSCLALDYLSPLGKVKVGLVVDVLTAPQARGRGIFTKLGFAATKGMLEDGTYDLLTGYPVRPDVLPGHRKVGWSFCEKIAVYAAPASRLLGCLLALISKVFGHNVEEVTPSQLSQAAGWGDFHAHWVRGALIDELTFLQTGNSFNQWRYSAPDMDYRGLVVRDARKKMLGYLTWRHVKLKGLPCLAIADIKVTSPLVFTSLLGGMMRRASLTSVLIAGMFSRAVAKSIRPAWSLMAKLPIRFQLILKGKKGLGESVIAKCGMDRCYLGWVDTDDV